MVQARVQEQEMQVDVTAEQEIEIEKFVELAYQRDDENPISWSFNSLANPVLWDQFYPLSTFKINHGISLNFPSYLMSSVNYFNPRWSGDRRLMNATAILEVIPSLSKCKPTFTSVKLSDSEREVLHDSLALLDEDVDGMLSPSEMSTLAVTCFNCLDPQLSVLKCLVAWQVLCRNIGLEALLDSQRAIKKEDLEAAASACCNVTSLSVSQSFVGELASLYPLQHIIRMCELGLFQVVESGRVWILLSLTEAETIRRIMHVRSKRDALIQGAEVTICLRNLSDNFSIIDSWHSVPAAPHFQTQMALQTLRFLNSDMHFRKSELTYLLLAFQSDSCSARRRFFQEVIACRRRANRKIQKSPLARIVTSPSVYYLAKMTAKMKAISTALLSHNLNAYDSFQLFDVDHNGYLSPSELLGGLDWLGFRETPQAVFDLLVVYDSDGDFQFSVDEWEATLNGDNEDDSERVRDKSQANASLAESKEQQSLAFDLKSASQLFSTPTVPSASPTDDLENVRIVPRGKDEIRALLETLAKLNEEEDKNEQLRSNAFAREIEKQSVRNQIISTLAGGNLRSVNRKTMTVEWNFCASTLPEDVTIVSRSESDASGSFIFNATLLDVKEVQKANSTPVNRNAMSSNSMLFGGFGGNGAGFGAEGFGAEGFGAEGFGAEGFGAEGFGAEGFGAEGFAEAAEAAEGFGEDDERRVEGDDGFGENSVTPENFEGDQLGDVDGGFMTNVNGMGLDQEEMEENYQFGEEDDGGMGNSNLDDGEAENNPEETEKKKVIAIEPAAELIDLWKKISLPTREHTLEEAKSMLQDAQEAIKALSEDEMSTTNGQSLYSSEIISKIKGNSYALCIGKGCSLRIMLPKFGASHSKRAFSQYTITMLVYVPELPESGYRALFHTNFRNVTSPLVFITNQGKLVAHERYGTLKPTYDDDRSKSSPAVSAGAWNAVSIQVDLHLKRIVVFSGSNVELLFWESHELVPESIASLSQSIMIGGSRYADEMQSCKLYLKKVSLHLGSEMTIEKIQSLHEQWLPNSLNWMCTSCQVQNNSGRVCKACGTARVSFSFKPFNCYSCQTECSDPIVNRSGICSVCSYTSSRWCSCGSQNPPYVANCKACGSSIERL